jgi:DMSO/TMAO reductase YedYZ molybdopterin-dependent catalytic subunit
MAGGQPADEPADELTDASAGEPDWVHGHPHEPNLDTPAGDGSLTVYTPDGRVHLFTVEDLHNLPYTEVHNCYIVSTGHGASGPLVFGGVRLADVLAQVLAADVHWQHVDVMAHDGFGARLTPADLDATTAQHPILLAYTLDSVPLSRKHGLVRLIVPSEVDDALRQVKWISTITIAA